MRLEKRPWKKPRKSEQLGTASDKEHQTHAIEGVADGSQSTTTTVDDEQH